jgi:hypothetical protein
MWRNIPEDGIPHSHRSRGATFQKTAFLTVTAVKPQILTGNFSHFLNNLESILTQIYTNSLNNILCRDINVNDLDVGVTKKQKLDSLLAKYNLCSIVNFPARFTNIQLLLMTIFYQQL